MGDMIKLTVNGVQKEYPKGITFLELSKEYQHTFAHEILLALQDYSVKELFQKITCDCTVQFLTIQEDAGRKCYMRGLTLVMLKAFHEVLGADQIENILVEYSIGDGYYCDFIGKIALTEQIIQQVKQKMQQFIEQDLPFVKSKIQTEEAMERFEQYGMHEKQKLLHYRRLSKANVYQLGKFENYFYGPMPHRTGVLKQFDLFLYEQGFILLLPGKEDPKKIGPFAPKQKLFQTLQESNAWGHKMDVDTIGALNDAVARGNIHNLILVQEAFQEKKIAEIAEQIKQRQDKKIILIAGPSSSGKTTFSHRLSVQLQTLGLKPHPIEVDNYFVDRENTPKDAFGNYDYESLQAIDVEQFNQDMRDLLDGKEVHLPFFNFQLGKREYRGNYKKLGKDDILVIEGIHALNGALSYTLEREREFKIYISALTQINIDEHNRIPSTDGRLLRRIVRDARTRGTTAKETIAMWPSVRRGEEKNIFPYQEDADIMFNSALIYELCILKQYAEPALFGIERNCKEYTEAKRLLKFLDYVIGISSEEVPTNSILREFIGNSCFSHYSLR